MFKKYKKIYVVGGMWASKWLVGCAIGENEWISCHISLPMLEVFLEVIYFLLSRDFLVVHSLDPFPYYWSDKKTWDPSHELV